MNLAVADMDQVTQQNAAMVEETTAVTHELAGEVETLSAMIDQFKIGKQYAKSDKPLPKTKKKKSAPSKASKVPMVQGNNALAIEVEQEWKEF